MHIYLFIYIQREHTVLCLFFIKQYICSEMIFSTSGYQYIFHVGAHRAALSFVCVCAHVCALSCLTLQTHGQKHSRLLCPWNFPGKSTGVGCHLLLQGIFPTQGWNPQAPCWQADSFPPHHLGSTLSFLLLLFSHVHSFRPHELQQARLPCPSPSSRICSNSYCIESMMPSNHLIFCCPLFLNGYIIIFHCKGEN